MHDNDSTITKVCTQCGEDKPLSAYHAQRPGRYGKAASCILCCRGRRVAKNATHGLPYARSGDETAIIAELAGIAATDWAYSAGIVDGEGSIFIKRTKPNGRQRGKSCQHTLVVIVTNTDLQLLDWLQGLFGGSVGLPKQPQSSAVIRGTRPCKVWQVGGARASAVLRGILPYMRIKREQAEIGIAFHGAKRAQVVRWREPLDPQQIAEREGFRERLGALNGRGIPAHPRQAREQIAA